MTPIRQIMTRNMVTVELDDKLALVKDIFDHAKFHHLLVLEDGELLGVVSDRDLFKALSPNLGTLTETTKDAATLNKRVHQIMSRHPVVLQEDASVADAIELFNTCNVSCLPVVNDKNRPVGIVSWRDILKNLGNL